MKLTVLSVAFPLTQVSEVGAEQVFFSLDEALVSAAHGCIVVAGEGSAVRGTLIAIPLFTDAITEAVKSAAYQQHWQAIRRALERFRIDLVHLHGLDFLRNGTTGKYPDPACIREKCVPRVSLGRLPDTAPYRSDDSNQ